MPNTQGAPWWLGERQKTEKRDRRAFSGVLAELTRGRADGVIIRKINCSARDLRDWVDFGELPDRGLDVHFTHDALGLRSRGGRPSADIQVVVAADYIRNLREENATAVR